MKLVGVIEPPDQFGSAVAVHGWGENGILMGHDDGTITAINSGLLKWTWLNPGRRISCIATYDNSVLVCFTDQTSCLYSLVTGLRTSVSSLPFLVNRVAVLEHFVICWNTHLTAIALLYRFNLEAFCELTADSYVVNVIAVSGKISVVCASDIYQLVPLGATETKGYQLVSLVHYHESLIIDAILYQHKVCLVKPNSWCLVSLDGSGNGLENEFEVNAPVDTLFTRAHMVLDSVAVECSTGQMVLLHGNNIQLLDPPFDGQRAFSVGNALFISAQLIGQQIYMDKSEFKWISHPIPLNHSKITYLVGQTDPDVTAVYKDTKGFFNGFIDSTPIFTSPVVHIDNNHAYTAREMTSMPLQPVNVISLSDKTYVDARVTTRPVTIEASPEKYAFLGILKDSSDYICLQRFESQHQFTTHIAVALILTGHRTFEEVFEKIDLDPLGVAALEDMAVASREFGDKDMFRIVVLLLSKVWNSRRIESLLRSGNARSLKVLASTAGYMDMDESVLVNLVNEKMSTEAVAECDAILWIYELHIPPFNNMVLPFRCLNFVPAKRVRRFALSMLTFDSSKFLGDIADTIRGDTANKTSHAEPGHVAASSCALRLLLASLELGTEYLFPEKESHLVRIVLMVLPAIRSRIPGAKDVFAKLLADRKVVYHKPRQRLLVPTPSNHKFAGLVFDVVHETGGSYRLKQPQNCSVSNINFSGDGGSVIGVSPVTKVAWGLTRGVRAFFSASTTEDVEPVEFR